MDAPSGTPPTPPYSIPPPPPLHAPNPSAAAAVRGNTAAARILFVPLRPNLHTSVAEDHLVEAPDGGGGCRQAGEDDGE
jgi:hypothetical protein